MLIIIGVVSLLAQIFLTGAFGNANAVVVEVVRYIGILFNLMWGLVIFNESITVVSMLGGILIVIASVVLSRKKVNTSLKE
ncbi:MAG: hypothetical protein ACK5MV_06050 [Aminipila sp.]